MDDRANDVTAGTDGPATSSSTRVSGPDASAPGRGDADAPPFETRAERRARLEATVLREPVLPALATVGRPVAAAATVVLAALLVLAVLADPVVLAAGLAWAGIVVAWGWPALHGSSSRFGSSLAIGVPAVLAPAAAAVPDEPYLRYVPIALVIGLAIMFGHQIVRRDGRPRLTESLAVTSFGLAVIALGTTWMPLARTHRATEVAVVGFVAIAVSALADLGAGVDRVRPWMLPIAMVLGGAGAVVAAAVVGAPDTAPAALVGFLCAAVAHSTRRLLSVLPAITAVRAQLSSAAASLLVPGVVAYGLALVLVG